MSRNAFVAALVSDIADAFVDVGACVIGTYTPPGGSAISGRMFVSRGVSLVGPQGQVVSDRTTIRFVGSDFNDDIACDGIVQVDGDTFEVDSILPSDASINAGVGADGTITALMRKDAP